MTTVTIVIMDDFFNETAVTRLALQRLTEKIDLIKFDLPLWGWWAVFNPHQRYHCQLRPVDAPRPHRAQARACAKNVRRWKRRRFIQSLKARV